MCGLCLQHRHFYRVCFRHRNGSLYQNHRGPKTPQTTPNPSRHSCKRWGEAPHLLEGSPGPPGPPRSTKNDIRPVTNPTIPSHSTATCTRSPGPQGPGRNRPNTLDCPHRAIILNLPRYPRCGLFLLLFFYVVVFFLFSSFCLIEFVPVPVGRRPGPQNWPRHC